MAERVAEAEARLMDTVIRDLILVDQVATIPSENKINSSSPVTLTASNVIEEIEKMVVALDNNNVTSNNRVLYVEPKVASLMRQSRLLDYSDAGLRQRQEGFEGKYNGMIVINTPALKESHEMILVQKDSINAAVQITKTDVRQ